MKPAVLNHIKTPIILEEKIKTLRAVIYCRVSSEEQSMREFSIPEIQIPQCIQLIREKGWKFIKSYIDAGLDGNAFLKRPDLQTMLEEVDTYDIVVVYSFDRLVRDDENTEAQIYSVLDRNKKQITSVLQGVEILSPEVYDPKSLNASTMRQVRGLQVSFDSKIRRERFMASRVRTVESGKHIVEAPLGYKTIREIDPNDIKKRRTVGYRVINKEEAPTLKRIFTERAEGKSYMDIACGLNKDGIKTRNGKEWSKARIGQVLKNSFSAGYIVWNKTQDRKFGDSNVLTPIPEEKWQYIPVNKEKEKYYKPIIDKELFDKAQEITKNNRKLRGKASYSKNILAGLIKCPKCGSPMVETSYSKMKRPPFYRSYLLCTQWNSKHKCSNQRYPALDIKEAVVKDVIRYLNNPKEFEKYHYQNREEILREKNKELVNYEFKIKKSQERIYNLNIKYLDNKIKEDYYKDLLNSLEKEEEGIRNKITSLRAEIDNLKERQEKIIEFKTLGKELHKRFETLEIQQKKVILQSLIEKIVLKEDRIHKIVFRV
jgi:site-specific DNA recombinase